jgi:hypothetical protein
MKTRRHRRRVVAVALAGSVALGATPSCSEDATAQPCTDIPRGGCPLSRGIACDDPACEAAYACRPGNVWELDHSCAGRDGGAPPDAAADSAPEASPPRDASADAPPGANGGPGCAPLQLPDFALGLALACPSGCCGCEDLFVCESGGWTYWSTCTP